MNLQSRETAYTALENLLAGLPGIVTMTRRLKHWADVNSDEQPAIFMQLDGEDHIPVRGLPPKIVLRAKLWVYVSVETTDDPVAPVLNPVLDTIEAALTPAPNGDNVVTLGGVVHHCWIEGSTQIYEGDLGTEAVAVIPVRLLVT